MAPVSNSRTALKAVSSAPRETLVGLGLGPVNSNAPTHWTTDVVQQPQSSKVLRHSSSVSSSTSSPSASHPRQEADIASGTNYLYQAAPSSATPVNYHVEPSHFPQVTFDTPPDAFTQPYGYQHDSRLAPQPPYPSPHLQTPAYYTPYQTNTTANPEQYAPSLAPAYGTGEQPWPFPTSAVAGPFPASPAFPAYNPPLNYDTYESPSLHDEKLAFVEGSSQWRATSEMAESIDESMSVQEDYSPPGKVLKTPIEKRNVQRKIEEKSRNCIKGKFDRLVEVLPQKYRRLPTMTRPKILEQSTTCIIDLKSQNESYKKQIDELKKENADLLNRIRDSKDGRVS